MINNNSDKNRFKFFEDALRRLGTLPEDRDGLGSIRELDDNRDQADLLNDMSNEEVDSEVSQDSQELTNLSNLESVNDAFETQEESNILNNLANKEAETDGSEFQPLGLADLRQFDEGKIKSDEFPRDDIGAIRKLLGLKDKMEDEPMSSPTEPSLIQPTQLSQPKEDRLSEMLKLYNERMASASEADADSQFQNTLLRAAIQAGAAIAGSKPDYSGIDKMKPSQFESQAKKSFDTTRDILKQDEEDRFKQSLKDPNTALGKLYKKFDLDADTAFRAGITPAQLLSIKTKEDALKIKTDIDNAKAQRREFQRLDEAAKKRAFDITKMLEKNYNQYYDSVTNADKVEDIVNSIGENTLHVGSGDVGLLYMFIKAYDPTSVVREGEIKLAQEALSMFDRIRKTTDNPITGAMLTPSFRKSILKLAQGAKRLEAKRFANLKRQYEPLANEYGIASDKYNKLVYPDIDLSKIKIKQKTTNQKSTEDKVEVTLPDGRKGRILRSKLEAFKSQYPDAKVKE